MSYVITVGMVVTCDQWANVRWPTPGVIKQGWAKRAGVPTDTTTQHRVPRKRAVK